MAKDTEKLIRQLSLISFLMAQGRPVSALEIKREVEGYSVMNEDAFARRFYADRAELDSLGIELQVDRPGEGFFEAELYSLPPENFYLPEIKFTDDELAALRTSLSLLTEGEFAYAEPLRLALQQVAWGHPNPLADPDNIPVSMAKFSATSSRDLTQRLARIETAISRHKTITFEYHTIGSDKVSDRKVDPYHLVFRGGQFYLIGHSHERDAVRVFRLSRIRGKVGYATKSEHDFNAPDDFERRDYAELADWQLGEEIGVARIFFSDRIAWLIERDFGSHGEVSPADPKETGGREGIVLETSYASERELLAWVLRWRQNAEVLGPPEFKAAAEERIALLRDRHINGFDVAEAQTDFPTPIRERRQRSKDRSAAAIRPERCTGRQGDLDRKQALSRPVDILKVEQKRRLVEGEPHADPEAPGEPPIRLFAVHEQREHARTEPDQDPRNEVVDVPAPDPDVAKRTPVLPDRPGSQADQREAAEESGKQVEQHQLPVGSCRVALDCNPDRVHGRGGGGVDQTIRFGRVGAPAEQPAVLRGDHEAGDRDRADRQGGGRPVAADRSPVGMGFPTGSEP